MFPKRPKSVSSSSGIPVIEDVLEKKKTIGTGRFYCALRDGKLWYSEDKTRESLIDIAQAQSIREGKARFSFEIITSSRTHVFTANSQATRDRWVSCLRDAMRTSLRKMSTSSYVEADDDNQSLASRSSLTLRSISAALKPGFSSTLPASVATRTPTKFTENDHELRKSSTADAAPKSEKPNEMKHAPRASGLAPVSETSEVRKVLLRRVVKNDTEKINDLASEEISVERESLDSDVNDYESVIQTDFQAKPFGAASQNDGDDDQIKNSLTSKVNEEEDISYANRADIEKFLNEQKSATEGIRPDSTDVRNSKRSEFSLQSESPMSNSAEVEIAKGFSESARDSANENSDEVFPLIGQNQKVVEPSSGPVMRRSTRSTPSIEVDYVVPEPPIEVELDVEFTSGPIPDLPHPRLEEKWSSAFLDIRSMLSDKTKDEPFTSSVQPGRAMEALKGFLNSLEHNLRK